MSVSHNSISRNDSLDSKQFDSVKSLLSSAPAIASIFRKPSIQSPTIQGAKSTPLAFGKGLFASKSIKESENSESVNDASVPLNDEGEKVINETNISKSSEVIEEENNSFDELFSDLSKAELLAEINKTDGDIANTELLLNLASKRLKLLDVMRFYLFLSYLNFYILFLFFRAMTSKTINSTDLTFRWRRKFTILWILKKSPSGFWLLTSANLNHHVMC